MRLPRTVRLAGAALAVVLAGATFAQQQRMVQIPAKATRAQITFQGTPDVLVNGKQARLAPGVRIFDRNNYLAMYGALSGTYRVKYLAEDTTGMVMSVWILTDQEIATPDPKPTQ